MSVRGGRGPRDDMAAPVPDGGKRLQRLPAHRALWPRTGRPAPLRPLRRSPRRRARPPGLRRLRRGPRGTRHGRAAHDRAADRTAGHRPTGRGQRQGAADRLHRGPRAGGPGHVPDGARRRQWRRDRVHGEGRRHSRHDRAPPRRGGDHRERAGVPVPGAGGRPRPEAHGGQLRAGRQSHAGTGRRRAGGQSAGDPVREHHLPGGPAHRADDGQAPEHPRDAR